MRSKLWTYSELWFSISARISFSNLDVFSISWSSLLVTTSIVSFCVVIVLSFPNTMLSISCSLVTCLFSSWFCSSIICFMAALSFFSDINSSSKTLIFASNSSVSLRLSANASSTLPCSFTFSLLDSSNSSEIFCSKASFDPASEEIVLSRLWIEESCSSIRRLFASRSSVTSLSNSSCLDANRELDCFKVSSTLLALSDASSKSPTKASIFSSYIWTTACFAVSRCFTMVCNFSFSPNALLSCSLRASFSLSIEETLCW